MKRWIINQSLNHPKRSIFISLLVTTLLSSGLMFVRMEDDMLALLPDDLESRMTWDSVQEEFGNTNLMFVAFGNTDESVFNSQSLSDLWQVTKEIEKLDEVDEVISIATLSRMDSDDGFMEVSDLQPSKNLTNDEVESIQKYLEKTPDMMRRVVGTNGDFLNIVVRPAKDVASDKFRNNVVNACEENLRGYEVHFGGEIYLTGTIPMLMRADVIQLMRIGLIVMVIILLSSLRSIPAVGMVLSVILMSLTVMMGFMGWVHHFTQMDIFYFSLMNTSMPIILLTIANSDGVHVITKFFSKLRSLGNVRDSVEGTMNSLLLPIFLTSMTTVVAFMSLSFAPIKQMMGYGITIGAGIIWAWFLSSIFLPSVILLKNWNLSSSAITKQNFIEKFTDKFGTIVIKHPKKVLSAGVIVLGVGLWGLFLLNVEVNIITFFKKGTEIRDSLEFMDSQMTGTMDVQLRIQGDIKSPETLNDMIVLQDFLEAHPDVTTTISIADVIKQMHRTVMDDDPAFETIPDTRDKVNNLFTLYSMSGDPDDFSALVDYEYKTGLVTSFMKNMSTKNIVSFVGEIRSFISENITDRISITITGMLVILNDVVHLLVRSSFISIFVSIFLIAVMAAVAFKRFQWGIMAVIPLSGAVIMNFGLMGVFGIHLSHITAILSSIIIGVGVDFALHYISQFKNLASRGVDDSEISGQVINEVGYPIVLDAVSNMSFGALLFSVFLPVMHIGGLMVFAMISTSIGTLTLLAAIVEIFKAKLR